MKIYFILFLGITMIFLLVSCENGKPPYPGESVDLAIDIFLQNSSGEDLLNPNTKNSFLVNDIRVFAVENGVEKELYNPNLDCPRNFCILNYANNSKIFRLFASGNFEEGRSKQIVRWNATYIDTFIANIKSVPIGYGNHYTFCDSVWVNSDLKFPNIKFHPDRTFVLVK